MTYMVCLDGAMLDDPADEFDSSDAALVRAHELKKLWPENVVTVVLVTGLASASPSG